MIEKKLLCAIQLQCFYMPVSTHYNIQPLPEHNAKGCQPDASMQPEHLIFMVRMFL